MANVTGGGLTPDPILGITCTPEQYQESVKQFATIHCLTRGETVGSAIRVETGLISVAAIAVLFLLILRNVYRHWRLAPKGSWSLLAEPADIYMLALFCFDLLAGLGRVLDVKSIKDGIVQTGSFCNFTGAVLQVGETGSAQIALAITVHTFLTVWCRMGLRSRLIPSLVVLAICAYVSLYTGIGIAVKNNPKDPYMSVNGYWCWIGPEKGYAADWIAGEYIWMWLAIFVSFVLYIPLWLWTRGNITIDDDHWWKFKVHRAEEMIENRPLGLFFYPLVYSLSIVPLTVVRFITFGSAIDGTVSHMPSAATFFVSSLYGLNGLFNVLLLYARPEVLLFGNPTLKRGRPQRLPAGKAGRGRAPSASPSKSPVRRSALPTGDSDSDMDHQGSQEVALREFQQRQMYDNIPHSPYLGSDIERGRLADARSSYEQPSPTR